MNIRPVLLALLLVLLAPPVVAQVPQILNYQGRISAGGTPFTGTGQFRFALVNGDGTASFWSNDGTSAAGSQPTAAVALPVVNGLYVVPLGDTALTNMTAIPPTVFTNGDVRVRVWFNDGSTGSQLLSPDQRITSVGYAMVAGSVPDGAITSEKLAPGTTGRMIPNSEATITALPNTSYLLTGSDLTTITLPPTPDVGDVIRVASAGGGWKIVQNENQKVVFGAPALIAGARALEAPWTGTSLAGENFSAICSSAGGTHLVAGVFGGHIYVSSNSGISWTPRGGGYLESVACSASGTNLIAAVGGTIYTSYDFGINWVNRGGGGFRGVASSSDGNKLVAVRNGGPIVTSGDAGVTWTPRETSRAWMAVASSADGSRLVAIVFGGQIYTSTDSGVNWTARESDRNWRAVACSSDGIRIVAAENGGQIHTSSDGGVNWTAREAARNWLSVASSADGMILSAGTSGGQLYASADAGATWVARDSSRNWNGLAMSADGFKQAAATSGLVLVSAVNGGTSTLNSTPGETGHVTGGARAAIELVYAGNNQFVVRSREGTIAAY